MIYETQADLDAGLAKWVKILRLQDWRIRCELVSSREIDGSDARIEVHMPLKETTIRIARKVADPAYDISPVDYEHSLVHELIHIHTHAFWPKDEGLPWDLAEQAVNLISFALIELDRK